MTDYTYVGEELDLFRHATRWKQYYAEELKPLIHGDVLEVGAGIGGTAHFLCSTATRTWTCLEPDQRLLARLHERVRTDPLPAPVVIRHGTLADLEINATFDTLLYIDVLEHIEDDGAELARAAGRLNPGGSLIVLSPAHNCLFSEFDKAIGHFRRYNRRSLLRTGPPDLTIVRAFYLDAAGMLASLTNRLFLKASSPTSSQIRFWDTWIIPVSRVVDPLLAHRVGKTVVAIWQKPLVTKAGHRRG
jgi:SAM-dependent methyltransferase